MDCAFCRNGFIDGEFPLPCAHCHGTRVMGPIVIGIQARLGSTRFPRKVLADIRGKPMIQHVIDRAHQIAQGAIVAVLAPWGEDWPIGIPGLMMCPGLDPNDVLSRYWWLAQMTQASVIMRLTADCPALNVEVCRTVLRQFQHAQPRCGYASNDWRVSGYPSGWDCEVLSAEALARAHTLTHGADREHVTRHLKDSRQILAHNPERWTGPKKLSVDTPEDLEVVRAWMTHEPATMEVSLADA